MSEANKALISLISIHSANSQKVLLSGERENAFRDMFSCQYPTFFYTLRREIPGITKSEELICMLIILNQRTKEMATLLCISVTSVNQARYRLRKRMGLSGYDNLNDCVKEIFELSCYEAEKIIMKNE